MLDRRTVAALLIIGAIVAPAAVLRLLCVGRSCDEPADAASGVPFCSLPTDVRRAVVAGFREGRSPDVIAVTGRTPVGGGSAWPRSEPKPPWPSIAGSNRRVPLIFGGAAIDPSARIPAGTTLDRVAPTLSAAMGIERPHPEVRSGRPLPITAEGAPSELVVEIVLKGVGSADVERDPEAWTNLTRLATLGSGTLDADAGSSPGDPSAVLTTIGTGGLPHQHGITGTLVRNDAGKLVRAWGPGSPVSVIATLGDDLDEELAQEPRIGLVGTQATDRGLIGGRWYVDVDRDRVLVDAGAAPARLAAAATRMLAGGFGAGGAPDLVAVALDATRSGADQAVSRIVAAAELAAPGSATYVVTATGPTLGTGEGSVDARRVVSSVEEALPGPIAFVEGAAPGGLFLDQDALAREEVTEDEVIRALKELPAPNGGRLFPDAFGAITVTFSRYC